MKNYFLQLYNQKKRTPVRGFVLPLTLIVCVIILTISAGISIILAKEIYFSKLLKQSKVAYYAADNGLMCALVVDDNYVDPATGIGIFQYNNLVTSQSVLNSVNAERSSRGYPPLALSDIKCATSEIFDSATLTPFSRINSAGVEESGQTTTFSMRMDLGDGKFRCATVLVNKTLTYRQIISRGFATCNDVAQVPVERAVVNTSETGGVNINGATQQEYTVPGSYIWTAPAGVTSVSVIAIGGGGAGGSSIKGGGGGGGGGLGYRNDVQVVPGNTYRVDVGAGGVGVLNGGGGNGGDSFFKDAATVKGMGGAGGAGGGSSNSYNGGNGGNFTGSGGSGGNGGSSSGELSGGGGGAGGYSGDGGAGAVTGISGLGGGGAGGSQGGTTTPAGSAQSGGGVGIYGQGPSGSSPGAGGSAGTPGAPSMTDCTGGNAGGVYGGGGAGQGDDSLTSPGCNGGSGAVRIIWLGDLRQFPNTRTINE